MDVQELSDRQEIVDLITRYARAVDTRSWAELDDVFTDDAVLDYSPVGGPVGPPAEVVPWIEKGLAGFDRYQHVIGQVSIHFDDGATARATAYFTNPMVSVASDGVETLWEVGGYYHHELVRTGDGWRSRGIRDDVVWTQGL